MAVYATDGTVSGFTGYGDDVPLLNTSSIGDGWYAAFLTDDPANTGGTGSTDDDNDRVMITAVGAGRHGALKVAQAIVEPASLFPADLPATITIFGETPTLRRHRRREQGLRRGRLRRRGYPRLRRPGGRSDDDDGGGRRRGCLDRANTVYTGSGGTGDTHRHRSDRSDRPRHRRLHRWVRSIRCGSTARPCTTWPTRCAASPT